MEFQKNDIIKFLNISLQTTPGEGCGPQANEVNKLPKSFDGLTVDASVGIGRATSIPWVTFTGYGQKTKNGIYPALLYYHERNILIVAFCISASNKPEQSWDIDGLKTLDEFFIERNIKQTHIEKKYNSSFIHSCFPVPTIGGEVDESKFNVEGVYKSLQDVCSMYKKRFEKKEENTDKIENTDRKEQFRQFCMIDLAESTANNYATRLATNPVIIYALNQSSSEKNIYNIEKNVAQNIYDLCVKYNADARDKDKYINDLSGKDIKDAPSILKKYCDFLEYLKTGKIPQNIIEDTIQNPLSIEKIIEAINETNLIYSDTLIKRLTYSLLTKPFAILSGLAGSGKTQLALALAKSLVKNEDKQLCVVPVGADWTNREPLLGYPNALDAEKYVRPESGVLDLLIEANKEENQNKPFFLILDEMNLSYVERYFADFLSAMESHLAIKLWKKDSACKDDTPESILLPKNLFIIGTINVDETTYMFSPKVLDRANVIEFTVSEDDMSEFLAESPDVDIKLCEGLAADMAADFVNIASTKKEMSSEANDVLNEFFKNLKKANAEFGYRTATEIGRFISLASDSMKTDEAIDAAIVQKLLPKLHGSRKKIESVTKELWKLCASGDLETLENPDPTVAKYKLTADKVLRMYRSALENGFTSFAEA